MKAMLLDDQPVVARKHHGQRTALDGRRIGAGTIKDELALHICAAPLIGDVDGAGVQQDRLGRLAGDLLRAGLFQEIADHAPEDGSLGVPLLEVKRPGACAQAAKPIVSALSSGNPCTCLYR